MHIHRPVTALLAILLLHGCASRPINEPISQVDPDGGYRGYLIVNQRKNNDPHTLFAISFSGGGTRAAALSYGALEELRNTRIVVDGEERRLLDEVDLITGISGGSFTGLAYALYGDRLFEEYETRFLKRNVQADLAKIFFNPFKWWKFIGGSAGRSDVAADYYDKILFEGATFGDLLGKPGPAVVVSGTDITTGSRLQFFQNDFDLLCSDLNSFRLARAAAASSAVPVVLSAVTLSNYGGNCGYEYPAWVKDMEDTKSRPSGRAQLRYKEMQAFQNSKERPYIHLVDGGVSDNIGVRGVLEALEKLSVSRAYQGQIGFGVVERIILIVVNAHAGSGRDWDKQEKPPGIFSQLMQSSSVPIERYSYETVEAVRDRAAIVAWQRRLRVAEAQLAGMSKEEAEASVRKISLQVVDVNFDAIEDPAERQYFMELPTSFHLPDEAVDSLREIAGRLMRESPDYQVVLTDLGAEPALIEPPKTHR